MQKDSSLILSGSGGTDSLFIILKKYDPKVPFNEPGFPLDQ